MAGQATWNDPGSDTNAYVVNPSLGKRVWYKSTYRTIWGKMNGPREVVPQDIMFQGNKITIDAGNDSPVWEKKFTHGNECRFTTREENTGMATYGEADVKPGAFAQYQHSVCYVRQVDSPAYPVVGFESAENIKPVINDLVKVEKDNISLWQSKEIDLDGFRAAFMGASRGLLLTTDGGKGVALPGGSAGQARAPYNTFVEGEDGLTTPSATLATHNGNLATALANLSDDDAYQFDYTSHERNSFFIEELYFKPVKIGGREYRAVALIDRRNIHRMTTAGGTLSNLFKDARERGRSNPALNNMDAMVLDDILYIPVRQIEFFRPSTDGSSITWGCGMTKDPRSRSFSNTSNICPTLYMGAGALLRGRRPRTWFTADEGKHGKGASYAAHYHDGWMRHDKFTEDGRSIMDNDSMLVTFNFDPGVGTGYAA